MVVPPDILSGTDGGGSGAVSEEGNIPENGTVKLACIATGVPKPTVVWRREGGKDIIVRNEGRDSRQGNQNTGGNKRYGRRTVSRPPSRPFPSNHTHKHTLSVRGGINFQKDKPNIDVIPRWFCEN